MKLTSARFLSYATLVSITRSNKSVNSWYSQLLCSVLVGFVVRGTRDWVVLRFSKAHYYPVAEPYFWWLLLSHVPFVGLPLVW